MKFIVCCLLLLPLAGAQQKNLIESVKADRDTALEVNPKAAFWRDAGPVYARVDRNGNKLPGYQTEVRSRWTDTNIYFLFVCPYQHLSLKPSPDTVQETYELWNWNVAEVFIGSDFKDIKRYKEFEISPQNEWIDLDINLHAPHHEEGWKWNSGFEHTARIDEKKHIWYAAARIPFAALDSRPARAGNTFRVNFYRTEGSGANAKEVMWQPVMGSTFHVPEHFGLLRLVEK
jgi:Carbohydrate family 9 binding domain-like